MSKQYTVSDFSLIETWVAEHPNEVLPNTSSVEWFCRIHRDELIERGVLIPGKGRNGNLLRDDFGAVAVEIRQREQQGAA